MSGMRIGYAISNPTLIKYLNDVKYSFNSYTMNQTSLVCGAEAVKDETKDVLTDAYFTAANKFYIAVSTEYKNGAVSDASMNIRGIIRALDEVASVNVGGTIFKPMTTLMKKMQITRIF